MASRERALGIAGASVTVLSVVGLCVYFAVAGLKDADKLSSVIGVMVGLLGLGLAVYGMVAERRSESPAPASEAGDVHIRTKVSGHGRANVSGRDQYIRNDEPPA
jgi:hypothetical protein